MVICCSSRCQLLAVSVAFDLIILLDVNFTATSGNALFPNECSILMFFHFGKTCFKDRKDP
jgi:hypothetical protein